MMSVMRAHGLDAGPLQRPILVGGLCGLMGAVPAGGLLFAFGSLQVMADEILRLPRAAALLILAAAFTGAGVLYGLVFRRAANEARGGWLFGAAFGFLLWMAAPIVVLPLLNASGMAAGRAAVGFFAGFLVWGAAVGAAFPWVHRPLKVSLQRARGGAGPANGAAAARLLRRPPGRWR